eukprot:gene9759-18280_t
MDENEVRGEDLDAILDLLESDFFEEKISTFLDETVEEIQNGKFQCSICSKKCKSKTGLTRHKKSKHPEMEEGQPEPKESLSRESIATMVNESCKDLSEDLCFPTDICHSLESFRFVLTDISNNQDTILNEVLLHYELLVGKGNVEKFFTKFYSTIIPKATILFDQLSANAATLLCTKLAEKLVVYSKKPPKSEGRITEKKQLSEREKAALQYLGGYVLHNLNKKIYKSKHHKTPLGLQHIAILQAGRSEDTDANQRLVDAVNRGGLWKITDTVEKLFTIAELYFLAHVNNSSKTIQLAVIVDKIYKDQEVQGMYHEWTERCAIQVDSAGSKDLLTNILSLYVKVRSFSHAKDVVNKFKFEQKKGKTKALRKEIQRETEKPAEKLK